MQCACTILSSRSCPALLYFSKLSHYFTIFGGKKKLSSAKCVFWYSLRVLSETFLILRRNDQDMVKNVYYTSCKVPVILVRSSGKLIFLDIFSKNTQMQNFIKIRPVRAEFHSDGRTGRHKVVTKLIVAFGNFATAPKTRIKIPTLQRTLLPPLSLLPRIPRKQVPPKRWYLLPVYTESCPRRQ